MAGTLLTSATATSNFSGNTSGSVAYAAALQTDDVCFISGGIWDTAGIDVITGITDSINAGAWTVLIEQGAGAGVGGSFLAYKVMSANGTPTVTLRLKDNGDTSFCVFAVRGLTGSQAGTAAGSTTASTDTPTTSSITTSATATLVACMTFDGSTTTISAGSGWTEVAEDEATTFQPFQAQVRPGQASGNHTGTWTLGAARVCDVGIAAFEEEAVASEPTEPSQPIFRVRLHRYL